MSRSSHRALDASLVLLAAMGVELALNRLAVPALRPLDRSPPGWYAALDHAALFVFHFASVLAVAVLLRAIWQTVADAPRSRAVRGALAASGFAAAATSGWAIVCTPSLRLQFALQTAFSATIAVIVLSQVRRRGHLWTKLGVVVVAVPLLAQYYAPFVLRVIDGADLSLFPNIPHHELPNRVRNWGQVSIAVAALASPYLFAPRPARWSLAKPAPLVVATFVGLVAGIVVREQRAVGTELAMMGLGIDIGPTGAPHGMVGIYLLALVSITWTLVSCLIAEAPARRRIGVGLGLLVVAGYAFAWPLQYAVALVGLLAIDRAADDVRRQESELEAAGAAFHLPAIAAAAWADYVRSIVNALGGDTHAQSMTSQHGHGATVTHIVGRRRGVPMQLRITRSHGAVQVVDVTLGRRPPADREPDWTLHARSERVFAIGSHPEPPPTHAPATKTGDALFDRRFRVRDAGGVTAALLDDSLRARATAVLDGWLALWRGDSLHYRVCPGRGAPLDTPIPISELAARGAPGADAAAKIITLLDLLADIAQRAKLDATAGTDERTPARAPHAASDAAPNAAGTDDGTPAREPHAASDAAPNAVGTDGVAAAAPPRGVGDDDTAAD
ncbi:MAG: hypothetical protein D6689_14995 [Deltaproteobacteria bacterium]|nr:MAG: hypothetical protein D6689_14995 [Deltaproteobacteria bacterium]